jgi:two-component system LytT family sensor kinase
VLLCGFLLFARFRYADVFIRYGVRILLAGAWASVLTVLAQSWVLLHLARRAPSPAAMHVFMVLFFANLLLLSFTFMDDRISTRINRWLFHAPDYRLETRGFGNLLRHMHEESEIAAAAEDAAQRPLELSAARVLAIADLPGLHWPSGTLDGETAELDLGDPFREALFKSANCRNVEVVVPISSGGKVTHVLLVAPGSTRPGLVTHDLSYLAGIAAQCGNRLDALRREREAIERQSHEALLEQQITEAELRALRAQINPHFLFNSLNTIADLIVRDPPRAEAMTLRLASVFRHVLAHSFRPLTSVREEIDFLRTYLYIEEARFGDRLQVEIELAPEVAGELIPSLILQPLVENALKHGLGPKPGPGRLWISARAEGGQIRLTVEDDGMGPRPDAGREGSGLGLANISERLNTLYHDRAAVKLEAREGGGSRVTVRIPRAEVESPA